MCNKDDVEIKLNGNPMVTGTRRGEVDLWKMPLPLANKLLENDNELHNLWHNSNK